MKRVNPELFDDPADGLPQDNQRLVWGKRLLALWAWMYTLLWIFLVAAFTAENDYLYSSLMATMVAFAGSFVITLLFAAPLIAFIRLQKGLVDPEEKLVAFTFLMGQAVIIPACLYFRLGVEIFLISTLLYYQGLVLMSRHSHFRRRLLGGLRDSASQSAKS
ncbi:MAG: hypothetical protein ACE5GA_00800 [Candidatus Zixiibacteriota bacterium]